MHLCSCMRNYSQHLLQVGRYIHISEPTTRAIIYFMTNYCFHGVECFPFYSKCVISSGSLTEIVICFFFFFCPSGLKLQCNKLKQNSTNFLLPYFYTHTYIYICINVIYLLYIIILYTVMLQLYDCCHTTHGEDYKQLRTKFK